MTDAAVRSLVGEVLELFDAGRVGLYEFVWILRGQGGIDDGDLTSVARDALDILIIYDVVKLVWERWDDPEFEADANPSDLNDDAWSDPSESPFLAVSSTQSRRDRVALMTRLNEGTAGA